LNDVSQGVFLDHFKKKSGLESAGQECKVVVLATGSHGWLMRDSVALLALLALSSSFLPLLLEPFLPVVLRLGLALILGLSIAFFAIPASTLLREPRSLVIGDDHGLAVRFYLRRTPHGRRLHWPLRVERRWTWEDLTGVESRTFSLQASITGKRRLVSEVWLTLGDGDQVALPGEQFAQPVKEIATRISAVHEKMAGPHLAGGRHLLASASGVSGPVEGKEGP
jgi:hypothetical protein